MQRVLSAFLAVCFVVCSLIHPVLAQIPEIPAEIQKIIQKAASGQTLTDAEQKALEAWGESMQKQGQEFLKANPGLANPPEKPCPNPLKKALPTKAPVREEYLALIKQLVTTYGAKVGKARTELDNILRTAVRPAAAADLGAVLVAAEAGSAAAYTTAWALSEQPDDFVSLNNLGVILTGMGDHGPALSVLFYADSLKPRVALTTVNIGWVYYDVGDAVKAKSYFEKAAKLSPELSGAHLGLGLLAECRGDHVEAMLQLRNALPNGFSAIGAAAYRGARSAVQESGNNTSSKGEPISKEKESGDQLKIPESPISESTAKTKTAKRQLDSITNGLDGRLKTVIQEIISLSGIIRNQIERARSTPGSLVLPVTFEKELFLLEDISILTLGEPSMLGKALQQSVGHFEEMANAAQRELPEMMQHSEKVQQYMKRLHGLYEELSACGDVEPCRKAVEAKMDALKYEVDQENYRFCKRQKSLLDYQYSQMYKGWKTNWDGAREAVRDYYAFSAPVIARVYAPSLNEFLNRMCEAQILMRELYSLRMGGGLPDLLEQIDQLECVEPEPPEQESVDEEQNVPKKDPIPCPFKRPLGLKLLVVSVSLDCEKFKIEGGELIVGSFQRDFKRRETTIAIGVGAQLDSEIGGLGAKMMVEVKVGTGDVVQDVGFSSTVTAKVGGEATGFGLETELGGRISLEGGPSVSLETKLGFERAGMGLGF
jgi:tetratricopeptide (TPR) repeat protein